MIELKKSVRKRVLIACGAGVILLVAAHITWISLPWVFFPTTSTRHQLTVTSHRYRISATPIVSISHYVDGIHVADYTLTLARGISNLEKQSHRLPKLNEGTAEVSISLGDRFNSNFTIVYEQASDLHKNGLLIHMTGNEQATVFYENDGHVWVSGMRYHNHRVYFVSGEREYIYFRRANTREWVPVTDAPPLERVLRKEPPPADVIFYSGWREYEWVVEYADSSTP